MEEKPLSPVVVRLGWVSLLNDAATEMIYPVMPFFILALGAPAAAVGLIEGAAEALVSLMKGASGWTSDRSGRRAPYVQVGYGMAAATKPILALATMWPAVLVARLLDRLGKGVRTTARHAMLADATGPGQSGRVFGYHRAMDSVGAVIGGLAATALLYGLPGQYRTILWISTIPAIFSTLVTLSLRHEGSVPPARPVTAKVALSEFTPAYWWTLACLSIFALANSSDAFLLLRARDVGLSNVEAVLAYVVYNAVYATTSYPAGTLSDRYGRWPIMAIGWLIYAAVYFGFAVTKAPMVWVLFAIYGVYVGMTDGVSKALVLDTIPKAWKATALGVMYTCVGLCSLVGSVTAGLLWDHVSPASTFWLGGGLALAALAFLPMAHGKSKAGQRTHTP